MIDGWSNTMAEGEVVEEQVEVLKDLLHTIHVEGVLIESPEADITTNVSISSGIESSITVEELDQYLRSTISSYSVKKGDKLIGTANESFDYHQKAEDVLELAVFGYTTSDYRKINKALRASDEAKMKELAPYIQGIEEGLNALPSFQGTVWRGARLSEDILEKYEPGAVVREAAFTSTSYDSKKKFSGNTTFVIQTRKEGSRGKRVDTISNFPREKEVLFNRDAEFFVLKKEQDPQNSTKTIVYLQEL